MYRVNLLILNITIVNLTYNIYKLKTYDIYVYIYIFYLLMKTDYAIKFQRKDHIKANIRYIVQFIINEIHKLIFLSWEYSYFYDN